MEKINKRIEVLTDISGVKIVDSEREGMVTIKVNDGSLVPFDFDGEKFYMESVRKDLFKKFVKKMEDEEKKLNRAKTETEKREDMKELQGLEKELEEITILYRRDPESELINLALYIKEIINAK